MGLFSSVWSKVKLVVQQNGQVYEPQIRDTVTLTREPNKASKLSCEIKRNSIYTDQGVAPFTPEVGDIVALTLDEQHNQFYGYIMETDKHDIDWCSITAYDQLWYMSENKHDYVYENMTLTEILYHICMTGEFGMLDPPTFQDSEFKIKSMIEEGSSYLETIEKAIDITYEHTGRKFYIWDDYGSISLTDQAWLAGDTSLEIGAGYIQSYNYVESILSDFYTASNIVEHKEVEGQEKGQTITYRKEHSDQFKQKYGIITYYDSLGEGEDGNTMAVNAINKSQKVPAKLSLKGVQGDIVIRGGSPILVNFYDTFSASNLTEKDRLNSGADYIEYIRGWFTVDSVTHTIKDGFHTMDIECSELKQYTNWDKSILGNILDATRGSHLDRITYEEQLEIEDEIGTGWKWGQPVSQLPADFDFAQLNDENIKNFFEFWISSFADRDNVAMEELSVFNSQMDRLSDDQKMRLWQLQIDHAGDELNAIMQHDPGTDTPQEDLTPQEKSYAQEVKDDMKALWGEED